GRTRSDAPEAELWMGAHPKASSRIEFAGTWQPLSDLIAQAPDAWVGPQVREQFGTTLPLLFKVLAAETPLSLQAHPSLEQAQAGYEAEQARGIAIDAPH